MIGTIRSSTNSNPSIEAGHHSFTKNVASANTISSGRKSKRVARPVARRIDKMLGTRNLAVTNGEHREVW
jgi:hypothetical protein